MEHKQSTPVRGHNGGPPLDPVAQIASDRLSDEQIAALERVSLETIRRWRREGRAPDSVKVGRKRVTFVDVYRRWLREGASR